MGALHPVSVLDSASLTEALIGEISLFFCGRFGLFQKAPGGGRISHKFLPVIGATNPITRPVMLRFGFLQATLGRHGVVKQNPPSSGEIQPIRRSTFRSFAFEQTPPGQLVVVERLHSANSEEPKVLAVLSFRFGLSKTLPRRCFIAK